jgi:hypothetical protein
LLNKMTLFLMKINRGLLLNKMTLFLVVQMAQQVAITISLKMGLPKTFQASATMSKG